MKHRTAPMRWALVLFVVLTVTGCTDGTPQAVCETPGFKDTGVVAAVEAPPDGKDVVVVESGFTPSATRDDVANVGFLLENTSEFVATNVQLRISPVVEGEVIEGAPMSGTIPVVMPSTRAGAGVDLVAELNFSEVSEIRIDVIAVECWPLENDRVDFARLDVHDVKPCGSGRIVCGVQRDIVSLRADPESVRGDTGA